MGLLAQNEALTARELATKLELTHADPLRPWLDRLCEWGLVGQSGRTQATRYFVQPELLRTLAFPAMTTLKRIEEHRLRALVLEDLERYPWSSFGETHAVSAWKFPIGVCVRCCSGWWRSKWPKKQALSREPGTPWRTNRY